MESAVSKTEDKSVVRTDNGRVLTYLVWVVLALGIIVLLFATVMFLDYLNRNNLELDYTYISDLVSGKETKLNGAIKPADIGELARTYLADKHDISAPHVVVGTNVARVYKTVTGSKFDGELFDLRSEVGFNAQIAVMPSKKVAKRVQAALSPVDSKKLAAALKSQRRIK